MTRVVALIKGLGPGGAERLLLEFARVAPPADVDLSVVSLLAQKQHLIPDIEQTGVPVSCIGVTRLSDLRWIPRLIRSIRSRRPDIVHVHSPALTAPVRIAAHLRLLGSPRPRVVTTEHNAWSTYHRVTRFANAVSAPLDDATITVSEEVRQSIRPRWLANRAATILHGIDLAAARSHSATRNTLRSEWGIRPNETVVVTVANYRKQKNYPNLLAACDLATTAMPSLRFVVVGQGPGAAEIDAQHKALALGERMLLLGYRPDAIAVMAASDIFTLASDYEGLPVALMEALAIGLAVVCTAVGGVAETITESSGVLVPAGDPAALADAIVAVASDPARLAELQRGARSLGETFDVRHSADRLVTLYRGLTVAR